MSMTVRSYHMSDCDVHNEPAFPAGPCTCGLEKERLIEEAASAIHSIAESGASWADARMADKDQHRAEARAALAVFEKALGEATVTPTDDDYKALKDAIGYELVPLSIRNHPEIRFEYRTTADRDGLIERILAAGFRLPNTQGDFDAR